LVHFSLEIWQLVAAVLMILLRINWPNFEQFFIQLDVLGGSSYSDKHYSDISIVRRRLRSASTSTLIVQSTRR